MLGLTQKEKDDALYSALEDFSPGKLQRAIEKGAGLDSAHGDYASPLFKVFSIYEKATVDQALAILLKAGANPNVTDARGRSVIQAALRGYRGDQSSVRALIEAGADVDARDDGGDTALQTALDRKAWDVAHLLIDNSGHREHTNREGRSVLVAALHNDAPASLVKRLFDVGIDVNAGGQNAALLIAARKGNADYLGLLLAQPGVMVDVADSEKSSALVLAVKSGQKEAVKALLDHKASPDYTPGGVTALEYAASAGQQEMLEMLLRAGATLEMQGQRRPTALTHAAANGNIRMVMTIIHAAQERGVELYLAPALAVAAEKGHGRVVELLLQAGAFVDYPDGDNRTPLMKAAMGDHVESLDILLKAGAKADAVDAHGMTAYDHAVAASRQHAKGFLNKFRSDAVAPEAKAKGDDYRFTRVNDHSLEVREGEGLTMIFNFWTQQIIFRDTDRPVPVTVQNFDDVQRQESIAEAFEKLKSLGGTPPEPRIATVQKRAALHN